MLALRRSGHSRVVAFIVVLAMVLLYTFAFASAAFSAVGTPIKIQLDGGLKDNKASILKVEATILELSSTGAILATDTAVTTDLQGNHYDGYFTVQWQDTTKVLVSQVVVFWKPDGLAKTTYAFADIKQSADGQGLDSVVVVTVGKDGDGPPPTPKGTLIVNKEVWDNEVDIDDDTVFEFYLDGDSEVTYDFSESTPGSLTLPYGDYVVYEVAKSGYSTEQTTHAAVIGASGASVTFVNEKEDTPTGTLTVNKEVWDNEVDIDDDTVFEFYLDGDSELTYDFSESTPGSLTLPYGEYVVYEVAKAGYSTAQTTHAAVIGENGATVTFINEKDDTPPPLVASIDLKKQVSANGGETFVDADTPNGPNVPQGTDPVFRFIVTNTGDFTIGGIFLEDSDFVVPPLTETLLGPGESFTVTLAGPWMQGEQVNTATASGLYFDPVEQERVPVSDPDLAYYVGTVPPGDDDDDDDTDTDTDTDTDDDTDDDTDIPEEPTPTAPAPEVTIPEEQPPLAPQTGDESNIALFLGMMLASGAGLVAVTRRRKATENNVN